MQLRQSLLVAASVVGAQALQLGCSDAGKAAAGGGDAGVDRPRDFPSQETSDGRDTSGEVRRCDVSDVAKGVTFRLLLPTGMSEPTSGGDMATTFDATGILRSVMRVDDACPRCATHRWEQQWCGHIVCVSQTRPSLRLEIVDSANRTWGLIVSPDDVLEQWEASVRDSIGKSVSLRFRYRTFFQATPSTGFTLTDAEGLILASEGGQFVAALDPADTPLLKVVLASPICSDGFSCAWLVLTALSFEATTTALVGLGDDGELTMGRRQYAARNGGAARYDTSSDCERGSPWAVWRKPLM